MKILIVMTNSAILTLTDGEKHPSGFWAEEFVLPYQHFTEAGYAVDVATIDGIQPSVDRSSLDPVMMSYVRPAGSQEDDPARSAEFSRAVQEIPELQRPLNVSNIRKEDLSAYDGIYLSGGHGAMEDMPKSDDLARIFMWALDLDIPVAAVCHGGCGLLRMRDAEGRWPYAGYNLTAFSHDEEVVTQLVGRLPFVLEHEFERLGANYSKAEVIWDSYIVEDRNLITGQNPYSSAALAEAFLKKLRTLNQVTT